MLNKEKNLYLLVSLAMLLVVGVILLTTHLEVPKTSGTIHLYITGHDNEVLFNDDVTFYEGDYLIDVLNRCVDVEMGTGSTEGMIVNINGHDAYNVFEYYYKIVVNCEYAMFGANSLTLNDDDDVRINYSSLDDWSVGC